MNRKEILELVNLALDIQEKEEGKDGFPFVNVSIANYGIEMEIIVMDHGFVSGRPKDGDYCFSIRGENSIRKIGQCKEHLLELKKRVEGFDA